MKLANTSRHGKGSSRNSARGGASDPLLSEMNAERVIGSRSLRTCSIVALFKRPFSHFPNTNPAASSREIRENIKWKKEKSIVINM